MTEPELLTSTTDTGAADPLTTAAASIPADALIPADIAWISRAQGHGGEIEPVETYRGTTVKMELVDKVRLEIGVSDPFVETAVQCISEAARTGEVGDGKIFILPVDKVIRIRTGE